MLKAQKKECATKIRLQVGISLSDNTTIKWFHDFMGIGYHFYDVRTKLLLVFSKRKTLVNAWNKIIKWWPDDEIKMRFVEREDDDSFQFILYNESRILAITWVFLKHLKASEHYKKFKDDYDGVVNLGFALYIPRDDFYELELFDYKKRITDVTFIKEETQADQDTIVFRARQILRDLERGTN